MWNNPNIHNCFHIIQWYTKYSIYVLLFVFHKIKYTSCAVAVKGQISDDSFPSCWLHLLLSKKQKPFSVLKTLPLLISSWWCSSICSYHEGEFRCPGYLSLTIFVTWHEISWPCYKPLIFFCVHVQWECVYVLDYYPYTTLDNTQFSNRTQHISDQMKHCFIYSMYFLPESWRSPITITPF